MCPQLASRHVTNQTDKSDQKQQAVINDNQQKIMPITQETEDGGTRSIWKETTFEIEFDNFRRLFT